MKKLFFLFVLLFAANNGFAQSKSEEAELKPIIIDILKGFQTKDAQLLNKYVDAEYGVGVIFRNGDNYGFVLNEDVDFRMPLGNIEKLWNIKNKFPIQFNQLPNYDSGNLMWRNEGLFVEMNSSVIDEYAKKSFLTDLSDQPIFKINANPKNSVYVTLAENNSNDEAVNGFQFVLTKVKDKYILSFIDVSEYDGD